MALNKNGKHENARQREVFPQQQIYGPYVLNLSPHTNTVLMMQELDIPRKS